MIRRPPRSTRTDNSFPTRRSSDLDRSSVPDLPRHMRRDIGHRIGHGDAVVEMKFAGAAIVPKPVGEVYILLYLDKGKPFRSEEHTSELQSLMRISYAVFCLKKKNHNKNNTNNTDQCKHKKQ